MGELMALLVTSVLVNNVILTQFLGMCPFMGVSKKKSSAIGMGVAVVFVIVVAALVTYALYYLVLVPLQLEFMDLITFILVIASLVQLTEMFIKKTSPAPHWRARWCVACMVQASSTAPPATRKLPRRVCWPFINL